MLNRINKQLVLRNLRKRSHKNKFQSNGYYYYGGTRDTFDRALKLIDSGRVLDIGAGFGNEAKQLLKQGFQVVVTETNPEALAYLRKLAKGNMSLEVASVALPDMPAGTFNLIICEMVLHFLERSDFKKAVKNIQTATHPGGLNAISTYIDDPKFYSDPRIEPGYFKTLIAPDELKNLYNGWDMLYYQEKSNGMGFPSVRLIARKK